MDSGIRRIDTSARRHEQDVLVRNTVSMPILKKTTSFQYLLFVYTAANVLGHVANGRNESFAKKFPADEEEDPFQRAKGRGDHEPRRCR